MILHIFMYNVISDFSAATPSSEGRVNIIDMTYANLNKRKQKYVELSGNIITDEQIDLTSPE